MVDGWTEIIGIIFGIAGVVLAIYSIIQQRKLETRLKEKERLKLLAKRLEGVSDYWLGGVIDEIKDPANFRDVFSQLQMLSQLIVSKAFDEKKDIIRLSIKTEIGLEEVIKTREGEEKKETKYISAEKKEDVVKFLEESKLTSVSIYGNLGEIYKNEIILYPISDFLFRIPHFFSELNILEKEFGDLIEVFSPGLLKNLKECSKGMLMVALGSAMHHKEIEIDTKKFSKTDDIGLWIYNEIIRTEEINPYLDKLVELKAKIEKLRESLITTSYT